MENMMQTRRRHYQVITMAGDAECETARDARRHLSALLKSAKQQGLDRIGRIVQRTIVDGSPAYRLVTKVGV